jgi:hypothetical protein
MDWLDGIAGPGYSAAILWTFAALIVLVIVLIIVKLVRSLTFGTFVAGGRNRKARLAVMDATAVDTNRRLVLVRRDDVEHLLLIGGASDIVVERDIRLTHQRRPVLAGGDNHEVQARPLAPEQPTQRPVQPMHAPAPAPRPAPPTARPAPTIGQRPAPAPRPEPASVPHHAHAPAPHRAPTPVPAHSTPAPVAPQPASGRDKIDDDLMKELEFSLRENPQAASSKPAENSLDDEMTKLLGELSSHKR